MSKGRKGMVVLGCAVTKELKQQLVEAARRDGRSVSSLARIFLAAGVGQVTKLSEIKQ
jgi:hypothetical protein